MQVPTGRIALVVFVLTMVGCTEPSSDGPTVETQDPVLVEQGEPLYAANCAECHGEDLRGTDLGPSHLSIVYEPGHHTDFAFVQAVRFGSPQHHWRFGDMAPVEGLSDDDIAALTAFVRENQRLNGFEPYPPGS